MVNGPLYRGVSTASRRDSTACAARCILFVLFAAAVWATAVSRQTIAAPPASGDTYVYRVINGYNNETRGQISYRVDMTGADRIIMSVNADNPGLQIATTEIYTPDGNWLRHPVTNRDQPVDYEFSPAYPAYRYPLDSGKVWSTRVNAVNPATGAQRSVRVDATVVGAERIRVPAGEFDTIRIRREIYAGDAESYRNLTETTISETEWFAPALGRSVRLVSDSYYRNYSFRRGQQTVRGDWNIFELVSAPLLR